MELNERKVESVVTSNAAQGRVCGVRRERISNKLSMNANNDGPDVVLQESQTSEEEAMPALLAGLQLTEEEAFALLGLCMTSPQKLDVTSEKALRKLASFCKARSFEQCNHNESASCEFEEAG